MFCRNCGEELASENAEICLKCGTKKGNGDNFCPNCGSGMETGAEYCVKCGCKIISSSDQDSQKSSVTAGVLGILLGGFGVHNFYLGYTSKAVIQLSVSCVCILLACCTGGLSVIGSAGMGVWGLVEGIMILCKSINVDGKGLPLKN